MLDIKWIRDHPDALDQALCSRGAPKMSEVLLHADTQLRALQGSLDALRAERNAKAQAVGQLKASGASSDEVQTLLDEGSSLRAQLESQEAIFAAQKEQLHKMLSKLPNIPLVDVPTGKGERDNVCVRTEGVRPIFDFDPKAHDVVGAPLGLSLSDGARISGARFVVLTGMMAALERALAAFMLDIHTQKFSYTEISPPYLVTSESLYRSGQLPKFAKDSFETSDGRWLIPTSEVPLVNMVADTRLSAADLPKRFVAYTPCFRSEAGAAGRDTRGIIRLHQFPKVELVWVTDPTESTQAHESLVFHAEYILQQLGLAYRVVNLCTGDLGFASTKTYDLEVWMPGQNAYREISSCSSCGDFQARRAGARLKDVPNGYVHTLNGSGLAVGRTLAALLENYQQKDGSVRLPAVLEPYMRCLHLKA